MLNIPRTMSVRSNSCTELLSLYMRARAAVAVPGAASACYSLCCSWGSSHALEPPFLFSGIYRANSMKRVWWSAPSPRHTFGGDKCGKLLEVDPLAIVINTNIVGRNWVLLAYDLYVEEGAEAIFSVSDWTLTKRVVYEMEGRGVPAFGPIWVS
jgi:hypothetical protein